MDRETWIEVTCGICEVLGLFWFRLQSGFMLWEALL